MGIHTTILQTFSWTIRLVCQNNDNDNLDNDNDNDDNEMQPWSSNVRVR